MSSKEIWFCLEIPITYSVCVTVFIHSRNNANEFKECQLTASTSNDNNIWIVMRHETKYFAIVLYIFDLINDSNCFWTFGHVNISIWPSKNEMTPIE